MGVAECIKCRARKSLAAAVRYCSGRVLSKGYCFRSLGFNVTCQTCLLLAGPLTGRKAPSGRSRGDNTSIKARREGCDGKRGEGRGSKDGGK